MFRITSEGIVTVNRGDSFTLSLPLNIGTSMLPITYELSDKDNVYFGLMEPNQPFETAIVRKRLQQSNIVDGNIIVKFTPNDTCCLLPGKYYYQVKLQTFDEQNNEFVTTIIDKTLFYIQE